MLTKCVGRPCGVASVADRVPFEIRVEPLPAGRYQYKFVIDRVNWKPDPNNPQRVDDGYGGFNSLLIVE